MGIQQVGKFQQVAAWYLQIIWLKIRGRVSHMKSSKLCLNIPEREEVGERNQDGPLPCPAVQWIVSERKLDRKNNNNNNNNNNNKTKTDATMVHHHGFHESQLVATILY